LLFPVYLFILGLFPAFGCPSSAVKLHWLLTFSPAAFHLRNVNALTVKFAILSHTQTHTLKYIHIHWQVYFTRQRKFESEIPLARPFSFMPTPFHPHPIFLGFHPLSRLLYYPFHFFFVYFSAFKCFTVSFLSLSVRSFHLLAPGSPCFPIFRL